MGKPKRDAKGRLLPGHTANRQGRPPKVRAAAPPIHRRQVRIDFFDAAHQMISITVEGRPQQVTRIRALFEVEFARALSGHSMSRKRLLDMYMRLSAEQEDVQAQLMELLLRGEAVAMERDGRTGSPVDSLFEKVQQDEERSNVLTNYLDALSGDSEDDLLEEPEQAKRFSDMDDGGS